MDIYSFINSRDVAAHCREIGKVWTPFEMAVIIGRSNRTMNEKHSAWREIISDYPDMPTPKNMHYKSFDSLHQKIAEVIDYEERLLTLFKTPKANAIYLYEAWWHGEYKRSCSVFTSFEKLWADVSDSWSRDEAPKIKVTMINADGHGQIEAHMDYDGNIRFLSIVGDYCEWFPRDDKLDMIDFDLFYVDIPLPFKRGDILTTNTNLPVGDERVFVIDSFAHDKDELRVKYISGEFGDGSDMIGWGLFTDDNGVLYGDHTASHDSLEYYRGKLKGKHRLLHYVNLYMNDEIRLPELLTMQP